MGYKKPIPEILKFLDANKEYLEPRLKEKRSGSWILQFQDKRNSMSVEIIISKDHYKEIDDNEKPNVHAVWDFIHDHYNQAIADKI